LTPIFLSGWEEEVNRLNEKKEGPKFHHPNSLMNMLAAVNGHSCISSLLEIGRDVSERIRRLYRCIQGKIRRRRKGKRNS